MVALGQSYVDKFLVTRDDLGLSARADIRNVETGKWRVRLEDVLRGTPGLADELVQLMVAASTRLARAR